MQRGSFLLRASGWDFWSERSSCSAQGRGHPSRASGHHGSPGIGGILLQQIRVGSGSLLVPPASGRHPHCPSSKSGGLGRCTAGAAVEGRTPGARGAGQRALDGRPHAPWWSSVDMLALGVKLQGMAPCLGFVHETTTRSVVSLHCQQGPGIFPPTPPPPPPECGRRRVAEGCADTCPGAGHLEGAQVWWVRPQPQPQHEGL